MTDSATQLPHGGKQPFSGKLVIAVVSLAILTFLGILSETSLNIAYSTLMEEFSIGASVVQWLTTGYMLLLVAIGLASLIMAVSFFSEWNGDWLVWALLVVCVAALAVFARMQLKIIHPLTGIFRRLPPWPMHLYPSNGLPPS